MNWTEFQDAVRRLGLDGHPQLLMMSGEVGDNSTRYLFEKRYNQHEFPNDETIFTNHSSLSFSSADFIWNGRNIRTGGTGGHPALAGTDPVYCAGRIEDGWFWFHSGHYHPKRLHALYFMADFITNSCATLIDGARDAKVDELARIRLRIYEDNSDSQQFETTFAREVAPPETVKIKLTYESGSPSHSMPMSIGGSKPIPIGGSKPIPIGRTMPISIGGSQTMMTTSHTFVPESEIISGLGINTFGLQQSHTTIHQAPVWVADSARTRCKCCDRAFGISRWKHHCRQCGDIVCDDCSTGRKTLLHPAVRPNSSPETGPVRVCDTCRGLKDII
jgi:hypothetical protein